MDWSGASAACQVGAAAVQAVPVRSEDLGRRVRALAADRGELGRDRAAGKERERAGQELPLAAALERQYPDGAAVVWSAAALGAAPSQAVAGLWDGRSVARPRWDGH
jgi:hypothetical protein